MREPKANGTRDGETRATGEASGEDAPPNHVRERSRTGEATMIKKGSEPGQKKKIVVEGERREW